MTHPDVPLAKRLPDAQDDPDERRYAAARSQIALVEMLRSRAWEHRQHRKLREEAAREIERLQKALSHIKWIKDCGIDGRDETGVYRNWPETERDTMYEIAEKALRGEPTE